eukprot:7050188-Alexandrium_andersonii.AAC.1
MGATLSPVPPPAPDFSFRSPTAGTDHQLSRPAPRARRWRHDRPAIRCRAETGHGQGGTYILGSVGSASVVL